MATRWITRGRLAVVGGIAALLTAALWPQAIDVEVAPVGRGPLVVTIDEDGETRVHHRFVVSAPIAGRLERVQLHPGDAVVRGQTVVARLRAEASPLLDDRSRAEAVAAATAARAAVGRARAEEQRATTALDLATTELARESALAESGLTTRQALDQRRAAVVTAQELVNAAAYAAASAGADLDRARARLAPSTLDAGPRLVTLVAPVDGVVLRVVQESETVVQSGAHVLDIGDPTHVEVVADLLTTDAVRVKPGMAVRIDQWGGATEMRGRVERVEPSAFTKVSALGVEEQRVNVIVDLDDDRAAWAAMGDGFRVDVRIVVWEAPNVLKVPTSALVRTGDSWAVYVADGGRARRQVIEIGQRNTTEAEVLGGLTEGVTVIIHPPEAVRDGVRIAAAGS